MKIAQICPYDMDRPGGVQTHIRDLGTALEALGHEVTILAPLIRPPAAEPVGPSIVRLGRARKIGFGGTAYEISIALGEEKRRLSALIAESGFHVMHYHTMWTPLLPLQVFLRSRAANVATFHDTPADTLEGRALRHVFRAISTVLLPKLDAVITPSEAPRPIWPSAGPPWLCCRRAPISANSRHKRLDTGASTTGASIFSFWDGSKRAKALCCCLKPIAAS